MTRAAHTSTGATGLSLHVGVNAVDPRHYGGYDERLLGCEHDAADLVALAEGAGLTPTVLTGKKATKANVLSAIRKAASQLAAGDLFVLSFAGYGAQVPDMRRGERAEQSQTWCLFDGQLIDDELFLALRKFAAGVRVLVLEDCSHSGTVSRAAPLFAAHDGGERARVRMLPPAQVLRTYTQNRAFYDKLQIDLARSAGGTASAAIIVMCAAGENQLALDGARNGEFTRALLGVWDEGRFKGNYAQFTKRIAAEMPPTQVPGLRQVGDTSEFMKEKPFTR
jgi:metacaspase-1